MLCNRMTTKLKQLLLVALAVGASACPYLDGTMGDSNVHAAQVGHRDLLWRYDEDNEHPRYRDVETLHFDIEAPRQDSHASRDQEYRRLDKPRWESEKHYSGKGPEYSQGGTGQEYTQGGIHHEYTHSRTGPEYTQGGTYQEYTHGGTGPEYTQGGTYQEYTHHRTDPEYTQGGTYQEYTHSGTGPEYTQGRTYQEYMHGGTGPEDVQGGTYQEYMHSRTGPEYTQGGTYQDYMQSRTGPEYTQGGTYQEHPHSGTGPEYTQGGTYKEYMYSGTGPEYTQGGPYQEYTHSRTGPEYTQGGTKYNGGSTEYGSGGSGYDVLRDMPRYDSRYVQNQARWEYEPVHANPEYTQGVKTGTEYTSGTTEHTNSNTEYPGGSTGYGGTGGSYGGSHVFDLDVAALKADISKMLDTSIPEFPADFGRYYGLFTRLAWHCAGSYRMFDGRGGCDGGRIRFNPELGWSDNINLDWALKILAPIKEKYADKLSWADLIAYAGDIAIVDAGGPTAGFCFGRSDDRNGAASLPLGPNKEQEAIAPCEAKGGECTSHALGATELELIYVNPEGPHRNPEPKLSAPQIRSTFTRMGFNDWETVALIGGGHGIGKMHGPCPAANLPCGEGPMKGIGNNTFTSGFEGSWIENPIQWSNEYFRNLLEYEWGKVKSPADRWQWIPTKHLTDEEGPLPNIVMLTSDIALIEDPQYLEIVQKYAKDQKALEKDFAYAWLKLMSIDMGPYSRCIGPEAPPPQPFHCPLPTPAEDQPDFHQVAEDINKLLTVTVNGVEGDKVAEGTHYGGLFIHLAWQSASTYRDTDHRGGTDGASIRLSPMKDWPENVGLDKVLQILDPIKQKYPSLSYADLIVLAGNVALEAAGAGRLNFCGQRTDATEACFDAEYLAPRKYPSPLVAALDNPRVMGLTKREYIALAGRPRSGSQYKRMGYKGTWCEDVSKFSNRYFVTLIEEKWEKLDGGKGEWKAVGKEVYITDEDYAFVSNSKLRVIVEEYAQSERTFLSEFGKAWTKLMNAGRYKGPHQPFCSSEY